MPHKDPEARRVYQVEYGKVYRAANADRLKAYDRERKTAWRAEKTKVNAERLASDDVNPDAARRRAWREANPEKAKEIGRKADTRRSGQPRYVYKCHKASAKQRGVEFSLTFGDWWSIWQASGKWELRGRKTDRYVMARFGDKGSYERGNVRICTSQENNSEAHRGKTVSDTTRRRISETKRARHISAAPQV